MKRIISAVLVLLLLAAIVPATSLAAEANSCDTKVYHVSTNGSSLNVRKGPGTNYAITGSLCNGTALVRKSRSGDWWKIRSMNGKEGWVYSKYVRENARVNVNTKESGLNVRSSRSTCSSSNILYSIPHGTKHVLVYRKHGDWAYVKWGCRKPGWASLRYLKWARW